MIDGSYGLLIIGRVEDLKLSSLYASVKSLEIFLEDLLVYLWMVWEKLGDARRTVLKGDVKELKKMRVQLVNTLSDFTLLKSVMGTIIYSLDRMNSESRIIDNDELGFSTVFHAVKNRCRTIGDLFESIEREIDVKGNPILIYRDGRKIPIKVLYPEDVAYSSTPSFL